MNLTKEKRRLHQSRIRRIRARAHGLPGMPRVSVFRSARVLHAQAIDDDSGRTIASARPSLLKSVKGKGLNKTEAAHQLGEQLAAALVTAGISRAVFDRRGYAYHGRVKAFVEGLRKGGIKV